MIPVFPGVPRLVYTGKFVGSFFQCKTAESVSGCDDNHMLYLETVTNNWSTQVCNWLKVKCVIFSTKVNCKNNCFFTCLLLVRQTHHHSKIWSLRIYVFERSILCSRRLYLFNQKFSKSSNIVKKVLKQLSILIYFKI